MSEPRPVRERPPPWTLAEGLRTSLSILLRRSPKAIGIWGILLILLGANARPGREPVPLTEIEIRLRTSPASPAPPDFLSWPWSKDFIFLAGMLVGWTLAWRLVDRVGFTGLHLRSLAVGVTGASMGVATLIALPFLPARSSGPVGVVALLGWGMATIVVWFVTGDD